MSAELGGSGSLKALERTGLWARFAIVRAGNTDIFCLKGCVILHLLKFWDWKESAGIKLNESDEYTNTVTWAQIARLKSGIWQNRKFMHNVCILNYGINCLRNRVAWMPRNFSLQSSLYTLEVKFLRVRFKLLPVRLHVGFENNARSLFIALPVVFNTFDCHSVLRQKYTHISVWSQFIVYAASQISKTNSMTNTFATNNSISNCDAIMIMSISAASLLLVAPNGSKLLQQYAANSQRSCRTLGGITWLWRFNRSNGLVSINMDNIKQWLGQLTA